MADDSRELLGRYQQGDSAAASAIFDRYSNRLLALARSRLSPRLAQRIDADDIVQSTYRSFFVRARDGEFVADCDGDLWRLLATMTLHKLGRQAKRHRAAKRSIDRETSGKVHDDLEQLASREPSAADVVATAEELHWLMSQFDSNQRQALRLRLQDLTAEEIAATIGRSERTVRRWLVEARELLTQRWAEQQRDRESRVESTSTPPRLLLRTAALRHSDYHLTALIGSGGMSKVYSATERSTGNRVAIKILRKRLRSRPHLVERFLNEAELVARFHHPNIVRVRGLGHLPDDNYFMVLDLVDGVDLAKLCRSESLPAQRVAQIVAEVADAIQHAHDHGVIHRDLKPGNVLVDGLGKVYVTDFGFAWFDGDSDQNRQAIIGTPGFMAPEQIDPRMGLIGPHTDIYGLGALICMLCSGRPPNRGEANSETEAMGVAVDKMNNSAAMHRTVPIPLRAACEKCLSQDWRRRFATAAEVGAVLRAMYPALTAD